MIELRLDRRGQLQLTEPRPADAYMNLSGAHLELPSLAAFASGALTRKKAGLLQALSRGVCTYPQGKGLLQ